MEHLENKADTGTAEPIDPETKSALTSLSMTAGALGALIGLTYVVSAAAEFRPWIPGERPVLASLFENENSGARPSFVGGGAQQSTEHLNESVVANLEDEPEEAPPQIRVRVATEEFDGIDVFIEDQAHTMDNFYESLRQTAVAGDAGDGEAMTRITHFGDSSIATDLITHTVRRRLQRRFGDGGHGFILIADGYMPYRHRDVVHNSSDEWSLRELVRNHDSSGFYGLGGVQFRGRPGATASFATSPDTPVGGVVNRFEIWHQRHRRGGLIHYEVDGGERQVIETRQEITEDAVEVIDLPPGEHRLNVRFGGRGQPRLYGVVLENVGAGVVYDSIGLVGARAVRLMYFDEDHVQSQLERRGTNLLILGFGGNESSDSVLRERYQASFEAVIDRMRGDADMACLVMAPLDQAERDSRGQVSTLESIEDIVHAQRAAAETRGCGFFNTWQAMGGDGAMGEWLRASPRLATSDLRHATPAGYAVIGNLLYKALLAGFADYLDRRTR